MARQPRGALPDGIFHVTARAVFGLALFVGDEDRRAFLWMLGELTSRFDIRCLAYCLMGSHYHLLLEGRNGDLRVVMQRLNGRYAYRFNERDNRAGHVFGERYVARAIRDEEHFREVCAYIEANPAKAGLCDDGRAWPWTWFATEGRDGRDGRVPVPQVQAA